MSCSNSRQHPAEALATFSRPVREWFTGAFGTPTRAQAEGWPVIQRGEHTLILSPTGSGKTLAAFLSGIDGLYHELRDTAGVAAATASHAAAEGALPGVGAAVEPTAGTGAATSTAEAGRAALTAASRAGAQTAPEQRRCSAEPGIRLVYVSPLKALNNDIYRNLRQPLAGIQAEATRLGDAFPEIRVAVRSGDTPARERRSMAKNPPHILITTPESLYLLLTGNRSREMFHSVRTIIVDEIHTVAGNKRGAHLALTLERLEHAAGREVQRIGLSATIRPLEGTARFLAGDRPVAVIDAGQEKPLDLQVVTVVNDFRDLPGGSIWPTLIPRLLRLIEQHRTTLIFTNSRRLAERTADRLNEQRAAEARGEESGLIEQGVVKGIGFAALGTGTAKRPIRAHHGSIAKDTRLDMERDLKEGRLQAIVGTSSLELGIHIGSIDLVAQLQSPKSVAQGLQRVGRSGHLVGQTSKGRIFPTHREDLVEAAALAGGILRGHVEETIPPSNVLDVLAQQIVAMVAVEDWDVADLLTFVRRAGPYAGLSERALHSVLDMLSGRWPEKIHRELRPRIAWDRVGDTLRALPGSRLAAVSNAGAITDRGTYGAYLPDGRTRIGELDEEFVFETRLGDTFMLGAQVWRVLEMTDDKVIVTEAPGSLPRMPFWKGDMPWRPYDLGKRVGTFRRQVTDTLRALGADLRLENFRELRTHRDHPRVAEELAALSRDYALDDSSAWLILDYLAGQIDKGGAVATDRTVVVEVFADALGDPRMVIHSPFGGRVNGPWGIALADALRERTGVNVEAQTNDDGLLFRFPDNDAEFPLDLVTRMTAAEARRRLLADLPNTPVFGAQFRQNAARSLLLPGAGRGRRTPFWLQRLRARDLLQAVRRFDDFPLILETYRDCLEDVMDLPHLEEVLEAIESGDIAVVTVEPIVPSPVAESLLFAFQSIYTYEWDSPKIGRRSTTAQVDTALLKDILRGVDLGGIMRPEAIEQVREELSHTAYSSRARTREELALVLDELGDLSRKEIAERCAVEDPVWLAELQSERRVAEFTFHTASGTDVRFLPTEVKHEYQLAFTPEIDASGSPEATDQARSRILRRFLEHAGPTTRADIAARYPFPGGWLDGEIQTLEEEGWLIRTNTSATKVEPGGPAADSARPVGGEAGEPLPGDETAGSTPSAFREPTFVHTDTLQSMHRRTLFLLRHEMKAVPFAAYSDFLARWQRLDPLGRASSKATSARASHPGAGVESAALRDAIEQLEGFPISGTVWERDVLPLRLGRYEGVELERMFQNGELLWIGSGGSAKRMHVRLVTREHAGYLLESTPASAGPTETLEDAERAVYDILNAEGALFYSELRSASGFPEDVLDSALASLSSAGIVTNDTLPALRRLLSGGVEIPARSVSGRASGTAGSFEHELSVRLESRAAYPSRRYGPGRRPSREAYRAAKRRVDERLRGRIPVPWTGRFSLVHRLVDRGAPIAPAERAAAQAGILLRRHGVVSRDCLEREEGSWGWPSIYHELTRMEMRGEVRRGYFVRGLSGIQFTLEEVLDRLREAATRGNRPRSHSTSRPILMSACDPANLFGPAPLRGYLADARDIPITAAGAPLSFARVPTTWIVIHDGLPALLAEDSGRRLTTMKGLKEDTLVAALQALLDHLSGLMSRVMVEYLDNEPALESSYRVHMETLGFYGEPPAMIWEPGW